MADTTDPAVIEFRMPSLGSDMESGTVIAWRVAEGDTVSKGDVLLDVDTDKSDIEVEVWRDARVDRILVGPGETVAVGTPIARLAVGTPPAASNAPPTRPPNPTPPPDLGVTDGAAADPATTEPSRPIEHPHDVAAPTTRTGPGVEPSPLVTPRMVYWPASAAVVTATTPSPSQPSDAGGEARPVRRQNVVALAMEQSNREIPHFHLTSEIDLEHTMAWLEAANDERRPPDRILPAALFLRAVALTVRRHPTFNGAWVDGGFVAADSIQLGVAIHMRDGTLMTPVLPDADRLGSRRADGVVPGPRRAGPIRWAAVDRHRAADDHGHQPR